MKCMGMGIKTWEWEIATVLVLVTVRLCRPVRSTEMGIESGRIDRASGVHEPQGQRRHRPYSVLAG